MNRPLFIDGVPIMNGFGLFQDFEAMRIQPFRQAWSAWPETAWLSKDWIAQVGPPVLIWIPTSTKGGTLQIRVTNGWASYALSPNPEMTAKTGVHCLTATLEECALDIETVAAR